MDLLSLYDYAKRRKIDVLRYPMPGNGSMSLRLDDGSCYIGMDETVLDGGVQEFMHLSHELGHCETGSFYSIHTAVDTRQRHEYRADKWAVKKLIPLEDLDNAIAEGYTTVWDLADHFGVTETFIKKTVCYYVHGNLAAELYF